MQSPLVVIVGETASGKSKLALELAERYNGEIIAADSRTVYRGMDIGTAKPSPEEQAKIPHHLLDIVNPDQSFNVGDFKRLANQAITDITSRGKLPILVGGTGLYIDSVIFDYQFSEGSKEKDEQNPRHLKANDQPGPNAAIRPNTLVLGTDINKEELLKRISQRVNNMLDQGLETEAKDLSQKYGWSAAMTGVSYQEWQAYFAGTQTLEETKELINIHTRQYAKRQRTWFKRNKHINWVQSYGDAQQKVMTFLQRL